MRSPRGFRRRVALGIVLIVLGTTIAHITISVARETHLLRADLIALGEVRARGLADRVVLPLLAQDRAALGREIAAVGRTSTTLGVAVLRPDGNVLLAQGSLAPLESGRSALPERAAPSWSELSDRIRFVAPVRLTAESYPPSDFDEDAIRTEVVGSVVIDESTAGFRSARRRIIYANGAIALAVLGVSMLFVHGFAARLSRPVRRLAEAAMAVGQGRFDVRVDVDRDDELGALVRGFNAMVWDLSTLEETKRNIVANVSHELRTPLVPIRSYAELLGSGKLGPLTPKQAHASESILRSVGKLETLIQSLLEFAMAYEGRIELARDRFDLRDVLGEVSRAAADLVERGVRLTVDLGSSPFPVEGDRVRLERVFTNLAGNAMKFAAHEVSLRAHTQNGWIEVAVADDGLGIATEIVPRIFDRFFQADASATRRFGGVGIGLALVKEFVTMHGGQVSVRSAPGRGATFTVRLPQAAELPEAKAPAAPAAPCTPPSPQRRRVLVVDDEPDNLEVLSLLLRDAGYEVTTAASGEDALRRVSESRPDMVVLDVAMEGIDGFETCRRLRKLDVRRVPVALVTAHVGEHIEQNAVECGADRVLTKPCGAAQLLGTIAELSG